MNHCIPHVASVVLPLLPRRDDDIPNTYLFL